MKVEFRKVPLNATKFEISSNSVNFLGNFSKISTKLAKLDGQIEGKCEVLCCKCGDELSLQLNEPIELLLSDGIYSSDKDEELIVVEVDDHMVDFDSILQSELESIKSEYYICDNCKQNNCEIDKIY